MDWAFYILVAIVSAGAVAAVALRNPIHCALCLALALAGLAGHYLLLGAEFIAFAQLLVYVGAVAILIVFAILLTHQGALPVKLELMPASWMIGAAVGVLLFAVLAATILTSGIQSSSASRSISVREMGQALAGDYIVPLEVLALLLTAGAIGAVIIALAERKRP